MRWCLFLLSVLMITGCVSHPVPVAGPDILMIKHQTPVNVDLKSPLAPAISPPKNRKIASPHAIKKLPKPSINTKPVSSLPSPLTSTSPPSCITPSLDKPFMVGETLMMNVVGETDLSGAFVIGQNGFVSLPLIGEVMVSGLMVESVKNNIVAAYKGDYLVNPVIAVTKGPSCGYK